MEAPTLTSNQQAALHRIQVRPVLPTEREHWNTLMQGKRSLRGCGKTRQIIAERMASGQKCRRFGL